MAGWKEYVLTVVVASLGCGVLLQMVSDTGKKAVVQLISGVSMAALLLQPLTKLRLEEVLERWQLQGTSPEAYLAEGELTAENIKGQYIRQACEAYIWNKAEALGAQIQPVIRLDEDCIPVSADIGGSVTPQIQNALSQILETDLGITKEHQQWTGNPESSS